MKVLHITNNYPTTKFPIYGIFVKEQILSLRKEGVDVDVFFINGREKGKLEYIRSVFKLKKKLNKKKYDLIHCHHALTAIIFIFSSLYKDNKWVLSYQNNPEHELGIKVFEFINKRVSGLIFKGGIPKYAALKKSFYLSNGVNLNFFKPSDYKESREKLNLLLEKRYILFVSSNFIRKQKRYDRFQEIIRIIKSKPGYKNVEELKMINVKRDEIPCFFNAADLHLLTSDFEGSPNSVKECMACNIPVVSTDVGDVKELLHGVQNSYVSNSIDDNEIAELVIKVLSTNKRSDGREKLIAQNLDNKSVAKKLLKIYAQILKNAK